MTKYKRIFDDGLFTITIVALERESDDATPEVGFRFKLPHDPPRRATVPITASKPTVRRRLAKVGFISNGKQITEVMEMMNDFVGEAVQQGGFFKSRYEPME